MTPLRSLLLLSAVFLSACTGVTIESARKLGEAGVKTSEAALDEASATRKAVVQSFDQRSLLYYLGRSAAQGIPLGDIARGDPGSPDLAQERRQLNRHLLVREKMHRQLLQTYTSFRALAQDDRSEEIRNNVGQLVDATDALAVSANLLVPGASLIQPVVRVALTEAAVFAWQERQRQLLAASGKQIGLALDKAAEALERERQVAVDIRRKLVVDKAALQGALLDQMVADYGATAGRLAALGGLEPSPDIQATAAQQPRLRRAVIGYLNWRAKADADAAAEAYDTLIDALKKLSAEHGKFAASGEVSLEAILNLASQLAALAERLRVEAD